MNEGPVKPATYIFGPFRFDVSEHTLIGDKGPVQLTQKSAELLAVLIQSAGRLVTKEDIKHQVWPETSVSDTSLPFHMHRLRQLLGDTAATPAYIETIVGRGYRFVCPVRGLQEPDSISRGPASAKPSADTATDPQPLEDTAPRRWRSLVAFGGGVLVAVLAIVAALDLRTPPIPRVVQTVQLTHDGKSKVMLRAIDASHLLYRAGDGRAVELRLDTGAVARREGLDPYEILDISTIREEALAVRPQDRGAEMALWAVRLDGSAPRRIGEVLVDVAAWSHDGKQIAYAYERSILLTDPQGNAKRPIVSFTGIVNQIRWAPNDRFLRVEVADFADRTETQAQYDITLAGEARPKMVNAPPQACCGVWLPDSDDYVFQAGEGVRDMWLLRGPRGRLWPRPATLRQLMPGAILGTYDPIQASDGSTLYVTRQSEPKLATYDGDRRVFVPYLNGISAFAVSFSPDGHSVAYIRPSDYTLWRAAADGTQPRQLTFPPWHVDALAWRPDSHRLAIRAHLPGFHTKIYLLQPDGGAPEPLERTDVEQGSPTWSPDSRQIAFGDVPERYGQRTGTECIHLYDVETRSVSDVPGSTGLWSSRWSPDGRYIAATRISDRSLMLYDTGTGQWRDLHLAHVGEATWAHDGASIFSELESPNHWVLRVHIPDGRVERIADVSEETLYRGAGVGLDGRLLFARSAVDIFALKLDRR